MPHPHHRARVIAQRLPILIDQASIALAALLSGAIVFLAFGWLLH